MIHAPRKLSKETQKTVLHFVYGSISNFDGMNLFHFP
jgi:hypothetical protein